MLEAFLQGEELERVVAGMDEMAHEQRQAVGLPPDATIGRRGCTAISETVRYLMDHPRLLPYLVDIGGWNIQNRDALYSCQAPHAARGSGDTTGSTDPSKLGSGWHYVRRGRQTPRRLTALENLSSLIR